MLSAALIVFREVVEIALVVSIVMAATTSVPKRGFWIAGGLMGGIFGAGMVAAFADLISEQAAGMGQEMFNAAVMFLAVAMLGWHSVWMGRHGREMAQELNAVGKAVATGSRSLGGLAVVVGLTVLREGSEVVLFLYGIAAGDTGQIPQMAVGAALGVAGGGGVGLAMYYGLLRISPRRLFSVTNALIILLAAGMASQGAGFLVAADVLPALGDTVWDSSWLLADASVVGKMLHTLIGYTARPAGIQILFYLGTLGIILTLVRRYGQPEASANPYPRAA